MTGKLKRISEVKWRIEPTGKMRAGAIIFADDVLITAIDEDVRRHHTHDLDPGPTHPLSKLCYDGFGLLCRKQPAFDRLRRVHRTEHGRVFRLRCRVLSIPVVPHRDVIPALVDDRFAVHSQQMGVRLVTAGIE